MPCGAASQISCGIGDFARNSVADAASAILRRPFLQHHSPSRVRARRLFRHDERIEHREG